MIQALYFAAAFGLAWIVGHSSISRPFRMLLWGGMPDQPAASAVRGFLVELAECPGCFGFWVGLAVGFFVPELFPLPLIRPLVAVGLGCATAGLNIGFASLLGIVDLASKPAIEPPKPQPIPVDYQTGLPPVDHPTDLEIQTTVSVLERLHDLLNDAERTAFERVFSAMFQDTSGDVERKFHLAIERNEVLRTIAKRMKAEA
jgi:hypothetical protein